MDSSYKVTQIASFLPQVRLKTDARSYSRVKHHTCVTETGTDALGQLSVVLVGGECYIVYCVVMQNLGPILFDPRMGPFFFPPVNLHPPRNPWRSWKSLPKADGAHGLGQEYVQLFSFS